MFPAHWSMAHGKYTVGHYTSLLGKNRSALYRAFGKSQKLLPYRLTICLNLEIFPSVAGWNISNGLSFREARQDIFNKFPLWVEHCYWLPIDFLFSSQISLISAFELYFDMSFSISESIFSLIKPIPRRPKFATQWHLSTGFLNEHPASVRAKITSSRLCKMYL